MEYGSLKPILPSLGGRSDAARCVVIPLYAISVYARMGINDGRWQCPSMPTVGAVFGTPRRGFGAQREDSPAHRHPRCAYHPHTTDVSSPHLRRTIAVPSPYQGRFMFGFRLKAKSEDAETKVRRWYGAGTKQIPRIYCWYSVPVQRPRFL